MLLTGCARQTFSQSQTAPSTNAPVPQLPRWADGLTGRRISSFATMSNACLGYVDAVVKTFEGNRPGEEIAGWGYDRSTRLPFAHVLLTDADLIVVGAGEGGVERADVPKALAEIKSQRTGWRAIVHGKPSALSAWGLDASGRRICPLGKLAT